MLIGVALVLIAGVAYAATRISRNVGGTVVVGTVQTTEETLLLYSQIEPSTADLTEMNFETVDVDAFGFFTQAPRVMFWAENGGGVPFVMRLETTDVKINGQPAPDGSLVLTVGIDRAPGPTPTPTHVPTPRHTPTSFPRPTATPPAVGGQPGPGPTPTVAAAMEPEPTATPRPAPVPLPIPVPPVPPGTLIHPGQMIAFEAGLRFLRTPGDLGLTEGDVITFTAVFTAEAVVAPPKPAYDQWKRFVKSDVVEDVDRYLPTLEDFGKFDGSAEDGKVLIDGEVFENSVVGFRTWIYRWEPLEHDVGVAGDDGVALYANGKFVAGRPNAGDPMAFDTLFLAVGWNKLEALVYNGPGHIRLELSQRLGEFGVMDANASYDSPPPEPIPPKPAFSRKVTIKDNDNDNFSDLLSDTAFIYIENVPFLAAARAYEGWFVSDDGSRKMSTGILRVDPQGKISHRFSMANSENLFADFDKFVVTIEPVPDTDPGPSSDVAFIDQIPAGGMVHIRHLLFSWQGNPPYNTGFHEGTPKGIVVGLREQTGVALLHARLSVDSATLADVHQHAEHVVNIIEGGTARDLDGVGGAQNPGDGFGVIAYAIDAAKHAGFSAAAAPDDPVIYEHAKQVMHVAGQIPELASRGRDVALEALATANADEARKIMSDAEAVLGHALESAQDAYVEAQRMGTYVLEPPPAVQPPLVPRREVTIRDSDDDNFSDMLSDTAFIHMENVPLLPPDRAYYEGWLVSDDGARKESTGILEVRPGNMIKEKFRLTESESSITFNLDELNASGQSGTATLTQVGADVLVELFLSAGAMETELVHVHAGQCGPDLLGVRYVLTSFVGGSGPSVTVVEGLSLNNLRTGNFAINAHQTQNLSVYTACGGIPVGTPTGENLFANFDKFVVTIEPVPDPDPGPSSDVAFLDQIPAGGMLHIRHLLFSWQGNPPYTGGFHQGVPKGIVVGLREQTDTALVHTQLSVASATLAQVHQHAEHVVNIIEGVNGPHYGDLDGNGAAENPGDGFGVLSYAEDAMRHAALAAEAGAPVEHAKQVVELAQAVSDISRKAREVALDGLAAGGDVDKAREIMAETEAILQEALETSRWAYLEAQGMGTYVLVLPEAAVPGPEGRLMVDDDFEGGAEAAWSNTTTNADHLDNFTKFLGRFGNETVSLNLTNLPAHIRVSLRFDLYVIDSWDGNSEPGPDRFQVGRGESLINLFDETFAQGAALERQSYQVTQPERQGTNLGFTGFRDAIYRDLNKGFSFQHTEDSLTLNFSGNGLQGLDDESWGIDNVRVILWTPS